MLRQIAGNIPKGRCVVLCGSSGCGKSTLLRCINGLIPQFYEGERMGFCHLNGQDTDGMSIGEIGELAASVFQNPRSQFFTVNSSNEVAFGLENHGLPQEKIQQRVDEAFRIFHLERLKDRNVYELSSGERQLISILSAWAMDTEIFLLDEPTANLDFAATQQLKSILLALKRQGKTLLLSEHRLYYLAGIADEYWVMENGEIQGKYPAEEARKFSPEQRQVLSLHHMEHFHPAEVSPKKKHKELFHPVTKLIFWIALMVVISTANNSLVYAAYAALILLTVADGWFGMALAGGMSFGAFWAANVLFPNTVFSFILILFPRIIAIGISMRTLIGRNEASRTLAALRNLHLLERLIMIVAVIFRFFPVLSGDMKLLRQSIRTRGAFVTP